MPAHLRLPRALTTAAAGCALTLALTGPALARPDAAPPEPQRPAVHATLGTADPVPDQRSQAQTGSLAGTTSTSPAVHAGTDVAAADQQNPVPAPGSQPAAAPVLERPRIVSIERGAETLAVIAIAAGALMAGAAAGFAGGRHTAIRTG
jgi:hypothetical protein